MAWQLFQGFSHVDPIRGAYFELVNFINFLLVYEYIHNLISNVRD